MLCFLIACHVGHWARCVPLSFLRKETLSLSPVSVPLDFSWWNVPFDRGYISQIWSDGQWECTWKVHAWLGQGIHAISRDMELFFSIGQNIACLCANHWKWVCSIWMNDQKNVTNASVKRLVEQGNAIKVTSHDLAFAEIIKWILATKDWVPRVGSSRCHQPIS